MSSEADSGGLLLALLPPQQSVVIEPGAERGWPVQRTSMLR
jgi:hypothetical protein